MAEVILSPTTTTSPFIETIIKKLQRRYRDIYTSVSLKEGGWYVYIKHDVEPDTFNIHVRMESEKSMEITAYIRGNVGNSRKRSITEEEMKVMNNLLEIILETLCKTTFEWGMIVDIDSERPIRDRTYYRESINIKIYSMMKRSYMTIKLLMFYILH